MRYNLYEETLIRLKKKERVSDIKKLKQKMIDAWVYLFYHGITLDRIADDFGVTPQAIGNKYDDGGLLSVVETEISGHLAENALLKTYFKDL